MVMVVVKGGVQNFEEGGKNLKGNEISKYTESMTQREVSLKDRKKKKRRKEGVGNMEHGLGSSGMVEKTKIIHIWKSNLII